MPYWLNKCWSCEPFFFLPSHVGHIALSGRTSLSPYLVSSFVFWGHSGSPTRQITALGGYTSWLWGVNQPVVLTPSLHEQTCLIVFWLDSRLFWIWTVSVKLGCNFARTSQFCTVSRWFEGSFWITLQVFWRFNHDDSLRINNAQARDGIVEILLRVWFTIDLKAPTRRIKSALSHHAFAFLHLYRIALLNFSSAKWRVTFTKQAIKIKFSNYLRKHGSFLVGVIQLVELEMVFSRKLAGHLRGRAMSI
jgi:hypothetical protein